MSRTGKTAKTTPPELPSDTNKQIVIAKRHSKSTKCDTVQGITKSAIKRLARRGGVKRISKPVYQQTRQLLDEFIEKIVKDAVLYTLCGNRKTVSGADVLNACKRHGRTLYGEPEK